MKFGHDKTDWAYVLSKKPDYIYTFGSGAIPGYETCWPTSRVPLIATYRRVQPLARHELGLGMPPGMQRTLTRTAPCGAWQGPVAAAHVRRTRKQGM